MDLPTRERTQMKTARIVAAWRWRSRVARALMVALCVAADAAAVASTPARAGDDTAQLPEEGVEAPLRFDESREPRGALTLEQAQRLALERSPELAASSLEVATRRSRAVQAGLRPNPEIDAEVEDFAGSGDLSGTDSAEATLALSQRFETRGKRGKRARSAELDTEVARWEYELARRRVQRDVVVAFVAVLGAQQRVTLSEELVQIAGASGEATGRLVQAGATPAVERTRANVEAGIARVELASAKRGLRAAKLELAATWGGEMALFAQATGAIATAPAPARCRARSGSRRAGR